MRHPLVFIPGYPGSALRDTATGEQLFPPSIGQLRSSRKPQILSRLHGPDDLASDDGVEAFDVVRHKLVVGGVQLLKEMETLMEYVTALGYREGHDFAVVPWDWRKPVDHPATRARVLDTIRSLSDSRNRQVVVMAHSTGGLVLRQVMESSADACRRILHVLSLGVPWAGTLKPIRVMTVGEALPCNLITRGESIDVISRSWAGYDLMPPDPARTDLKDEDGLLGLVVDGNRAQTAPLRDTTWMPGPHSAPRAASADRRLGERARTITPAGGYVVPITNIVGWGADTDVACQIANGRVVGFATSHDGDATIPARSAAWIDGPMVRTYQVPIGMRNGASNRRHSQLWEGPPARQVMEWVLLDAPRTPYFHAAFDEDDLFRRSRVVRIRLTCTDPDGMPLDERAPYLAIARFGATAHQPARDYSLDRWGRATLEYVRHNNPTMGFYLAPIDLAWQYGGQEMHWHFDMKFLERH